MTVFNVAFAYSNADKLAVVATGRPGWVSGLGVRSDNTLEYYVSTADADGKSGSSWLNATDIADWVDPVVTTMTSLLYFQLFTNAEQLAIFGSDIPQVRQAIAFTQAAGMVDLSNTLVIAGIDALVAFGLITADRAVRIKSGLPPVVSEPVVSPPVVS
ncbi:MAG: hypothetical protein ACRYG4_04185 [Janthinobacterium lividum]